MDCTGIIELKLIKGTVDSDLFFDFIRGDLLPQLQPFDGTNPHSVVILDNCSIHYVESIHELFEASGVLLLFLPSYSPDLMPIEEAFSSVKMFLCTCVPIIGQCSADNRYMPIIGHLRYTLNMSVLSSID